MHPQMFLCQGLKKYLLTIGNQLLGHTSCLGIQQTGVLEVQLHCNHHVSACVVSTPKFFTATDELCEVGVWQVLAAFLNAYLSYSDRWIFFGVSRCEKKLWVNFVVCTLDVIIGTHSPLSGSTVSSSPFPRTTGGADRVFMCLPRELERASVRAK